MSDATLQLITPILNFVLVGVLGYIGKQIAKVVPVVIEFIISKVGLTNYQKCKSVAWDIFNEVEEHFRLSDVVGDKVQAKILMFETLIKQKIPGITDEEIQSFRQSIAGEINKNKQVVQQAASYAETVVSVTPVIKYFTEEGIELIPVQTLNEETTNIQQ
jgi:hypothetical protein